MPDYFRFELKLPMNNNSHQSVRGKYAAYLEQSGPACCGLSHGFTEWFESEDDLRSYVNLNYPCADWPSPSDKSHTEVSENQDESKNAAESDSESRVEETPNPPDEPDHGNVIAGPLVEESIEVDESEEEDEDGDEDEDEDEDDSISISWAGTFEDLCENMNYQAQIVRVRFFEDLKVNHPDKSVDFSYSDSDPTPSVPEALRDQFDRWLASGEMEFC